MNVTSKQIEMALKEIKSQLDLKWGMDNLQGMSLSDGNIVFDTVFGEYNFHIPSQISDEDLEYLLSLENGNDIAY